MFAGIGYLGSLGVGVYLYDQRPDLPLAALVVLAAFDVVVGITGFVARCQRATVAERPRLQWCVWGALTATAVAVAALVLKALVDWPSSVLAVCVGATIVIPLSLALGASAARPIRIDRLLVHTIALAGLRRARRRVVRPRRARPRPRARRADEQTLLGLSMLAAAIAALLWVPARDGSPTSRPDASTASATRPTRCSARSAAGSTRALPLDELLLQLAESLKKTMDARGRRGVDAGRRSARARGVGARPRSGRACPLGRGGGARSSHAPACPVRRGPQVWLPALLAGPRRPRRCASRRSRTRASCSG